VEVSPYSSFPILAEALSDELFAPHGDGEVIRMQREIWGGICADLERDLRGLEGVSQEDLKRHLHRIRGYVATASLLRLSEILMAWENAPDPARATGAFLPEALEVSKRSISEMEGRHPHLVDPAQGSD